MVGNAQASVACPTDADVPTAASPEAANALLCDLNTLRARAGLQPLRWDWRLWAGAQRMAGAMAKQRFFSHVMPDGRNLADRMLPTGYIPDDGDWILAENLAFGERQLSSPLAIAIGWMNSPEHRRNIMDPELRDIGVGMLPAQLADDGFTGMIYVADFGVAQPDPPHSRASRAKRARVGHIRVKAARTCRSLGRCVSASNS